MENMNTAKNNIINTKKKRLIEYNELYLHEIVTNIEFDVFIFIPHDNEQISMLNKVNWFKNKQIIILNS